MGAGACGPSSSALPVLGLACPRCRRTRAPPAPAGGPQLRRLARAKQGDSHKAADAKRKRRERATAARAAIPQSDAEAVKAAAGRFDYSLGFTWSKKRAEGACATLADRSAPGLAQLAAAAAATTATASAARSAAEPTQSAARAAAAASQPSAARAGPPSPFLPSARARTHTRTLLTHAHKLHPHSLDQVLLYRTRIYVSIPNRRCCTKPLHRPLFWPQSVLPMKQTKTHSPSSKTLNLHTTPTL